MTATVLYVILDPQTEQLFREETLSLLVVQTLKLTNQGQASKFAGNALTAVQNVCDAYLLQTVQAARGHLPPQKKPPLPYVGGIFHRLANRQRRTALPSEIKP